MRQQVSHAIEFRSRVVLSLQSRTQRPKLRFDMVSTFREVLGLWPSLRDFASESDAPLVSARKWQQRDSIPPEFWIQVSEAAQRRGFNGITVELLTRLRAAQSNGGPLQPEAGPPGELQEAS